MGDDRPTLFDPSAPKSDNPKRHAESSIAFLDRVTWPTFGLIRQELDAWFAAYPSDERHELATRFRSDDERNHVAAWWELYLHALMRALGYEVEVHPEIAGTTKKPDFRVIGPTGSFLLEAVSTRAGIVRDDDRHEARESRFLDIVDTVRSPHFSLWVGDISVGQRDVPKRVITRRIENWLTSLDVTEPHWADRAADRPALVFEYDDWRVEFEASRRGDWESPEPRSRIIGSGPGVSGYVDTASRLRTNLSEKCRRYGKPAEPYVIALLSDQDGLDLEDITGALFGSLAWAYYEDDPDREGHWVRHPDGVLGRGNRTVNDHVSAYMFASRLKPESFFRLLPDVFENPAADRPFSIVGPFKRFELDLERMGIRGWQDATATGAEVFDLPSWWPGFKYG
jgi:hypothetical protein